MVIALLSAALCSCKVGRSTTVADTGKRWEELSFDDKTAYMIDVVEPQMREAFVAHDPQRYSDFGCATCHGSGMDDGTYSMPNPELPHLREKSFYREHRKGDPETTRFMWRGVTKPMAKMLGKTAGHSGEVDCAACHVIDDR
ncbi:MAG: hypothetical protein AB1Z98_37325 [Nannocystaceae bacterium]